MMKMMRGQEGSDGKSGRHGGKMDGAPAVGIGDMRDMMKNQLMRKVKKNPLKKWMKPLDILIIKQIKFKK